MLRKKRTDFILCLFHKYAWIFYIENILSDYHNIYLSCHILHSNAEFSFAILQLMFNQGSLAVWPSELGARSYGSKDAIKWTKRSYVICVNIQQVNIVA